MSRFSLVVALISVIAAQSTPPQPQEPRGRDTNDDGIWKTRADDKPTTISAFDEIRDILNSGEGQRWPLRKFSQTPVPTPGRTTVDPELRHYLNILGLDKRSTTTVATTRTPLKKYHDWWHLRPRLRHSRHVESPSLPTPEKIADKDNHKPVIHDCMSYHPTVKEEQGIGTYVFTINATDRDPIDSGGKITYKFISTMGEKERFTVDSETGVVKTNDMFDHDEPSREKEVYVTVRVTDNGQPQLDDACTIRIKIIDINDNPPVFDKVTYAESVPQDHPVEKPVMRISATDIDEGDNSIVRYALDTSSPDQQYFFIDKETGLVYLNRSIDKTPGYRFRMSAVVHDLGKPSLQSSMNIDILVVDSHKKPPIFTEFPKTPVRLKENLVDFTMPLATFKAISNIDDEEKLQFELVIGQTDQTNKHHTFVLEPEADTAVLKLGNHLDYERTTYYILTVRVSNNYRLAAETLVYVEVEDVNDNIPIFSEIRSGTVLENEPVGTPVMQVRAFDADGTTAHNQITYSLADSNDPFTIDPVTGNITTLEMFDREQRSFYNIKIFATDNSESALIPGRHNVGQHVFLIEIADKNDNPPKFGRDTYVAAEIAESANINELVTQIEAKDVDTASVVTYSIIDGNTYDAFSITNYTGEIRVKNPLDYENITSYSLDVRASDGIYEDYAKVLITVLNINDNPPMFVMNYSVTILEETMYDDCIITVQAYDPDIKDRNANQNIVYALVKVEQKKYLSIDNTGCVRLLKPLDRDYPNGYEYWQILVMAADQGGVLGSDSLRATTEIILKLDDVNDNAPHLTTGTVTVYENEGPQKIVILQAEDYDGPDNGPPFKYRLNTSHPYYVEVKDKFSIKADELDSLTVFDRENKKEYHIPITISDNGTPTQNGLSILKVIIGDKNDNAMKPGHSDAFVYTYNSGVPNPPVKVGRVYVDDPDDWDIKDKTFSWMPTEEDRPMFLELSFTTGDVLLRENSLPGVYQLVFNVTEESEIIPFHHVKATMDVTVMNVPQEAIDNAASIRLKDITAEDFIDPRPNGISLRDIMRTDLAELYNTSVENVDIFTIANRVIKSQQYLDVFFSAHGSPYKDPIKLHFMLDAVREKMEQKMNTKITMVGINECLLEKDPCDGSCYNEMVIDPNPIGVYTNLTSFVGINIYYKAKCECNVAPVHCLNGGTRFGDRCECPEGASGQFCEITNIGFKGNGFAMFPALPNCEGRISFTIRTTTADSLFLYNGPTSYNPEPPVQDYIAMELKNGFLFLSIDYGSGVTVVNNTDVTVSDGNPHYVEVTLTKTTIELKIDGCQFTHCVALGAPVGLNEMLNVAGPLQLGGVETDLQDIGSKYKWNHIPSTGNTFVGCISNLTVNEYMYNLGRPNYSMNTEPTCEPASTLAVSFGLSSTFIAAIVCCAVILLALLLLVVVHKSKKDNWTEKELDDIRENIIAYEDEGGGEGDAGYDLHVLRQMYQPPVDGDPYMRGPGYGAIQYYVRYRLPTERKNNLPKWLKKILFIHPETADTDSVSLSDSVYPFSEAALAELSLALDETRRFRDNMDATELDIIELDTEAPESQPRRNNDHGTTTVSTRPIIHLIEQQDDICFEGTDPENKNSDPCECCSDQLELVLLPPVDFRNEPARADDRQILSSTVVEITPAILEIPKAVEIPPPKGILRTPAITLVSFEPTTPPLPPRLTAPSEMPPLPKNVIGTTYPSPPTPQRKISTSTSDLSIPLARNLNDVYTLSSSATDLSLLPTAGAEWDKSYLKPERFTASRTDQPTQVVPAIHHGTQELQYINPRDLDFTLMNAPPPDISGFLDDKKSVLDRDSDLYSMDNVRHYAYEGDGNTSGSLSSLASCTDDGDLKFNYLSTFGPRFRKLADMYGDSEEERPPHEESWC